ncbi:unnamed protein product [Spirodela intermedia]|uniref:Uncharacterized protein n=1 Tax=Spirodela intermedia TaxID=51605 RepID=A0A7I8LDA9_SPIIN|nr:unnamed protein product [Spirodela intermedia]
MIIGREGVVSLLEGCRSMRELKQVHGYMTTTALVRDVVPLSRLVDFCTGAGDLDYARSVFLRIDNPSVFIWNSMIRGFSSSELPAEALAMYRDMQRRSHRPDNFTFPFVLRSCAATSDSQFCGCVHSRVVRSGYESDLYVSTSLIHGYAACGDVESAEVVFEEMPRRNVVAWTAMIAGYVKSGRTQDAVRLLQQMDFAGVEANEVTMANVLAACGRIRDIDTGRWALRRLHRLGPDVIRSNVVLATAVLDMYARCGSLRTARELFDGMTHRNLASWNAIITAYNQYERCDEVVELFAEMRGHGVRPDKVTLLGLLGTCARRGDRGLGLGVHAYVEKTSCSQDVQVRTTLSHMYAKAGDVQSAFQVFWGLERKDVVAWTGMIIGLGSHGRGHEAVDLFEAMQKDGVAPDGIAFIGVLSACSHSGLVEEGRRYFDAMRSDYGIAPSLHHYGCMVDLLSRAGRIAEAERFVDSMPLRPNAAIWSAMLSGCRIHDDVEVAERLRRRMAELSPANSGVFVLLSNVYAARGRWDGVGWARASMRQKRMEKSLVHSSVGG